MYSQKALKTASSNSASSAIGATAIDSELSKLLTSTANNESDKVSSITENNDSPLSSTSESREDSDTQDDDNEELNFDPAMFAALIRQQLSAYQSTVVSNDGTDDDSGLGHSRADFSTGTKTNSDALKNFDSRVGSPTHEETDSNGILSDEQAIKHPVYKLALNILKDMNDKGLFSELHEESLLALVSKNFIQTHRPSLCSVNQRASFNLELLDYAEKHFHIERNSTEKKRDSKPGDNKHLRRLMFARSSSIILEEPEEMKTQEYTTVSGPRI